MGSGSFGASSSWGIWIWNLESGIWNRDRSMSSTGPAVGPLARPAQGESEFGIWNLESGIWNRDRSMSSTGPAVGPLAHPAQGESEFGIWNLESGIGIASTPGSFSTPTETRVPPAQRDAGQEERDGRGEDQSDDDPFDGTIRRPPRAGTSPDDHQHGERPPERDEGESHQQKIGEPGDRRDAPHDDLAAARARIRSRQDSSCRRRDSSISARIAAPAVAAGTCFASGWLRHLISILPSLSPRSPMTTRSGIPIRSASLNFTPGR